MSLSDVLFDVVAALRRINLGVTSSTNGLVTALKLFEQVLLNAHPADMEDLRDTWSGEIAKLKFGIKALKEPRITALHDRIFTNIMKINARIVPRGITILFDQFIRGITYFEHEQQASAMPVYHRLFSCGPGDDAFRETSIVCRSNVTKADKKQRQLKIMKCYVERLVYDELYRHEAFHFNTTGSDELAQDSQHLFRLELTKADFSSCFRGHDVSVSVTYQDGMPTELKLSHLRNGQLDYTETFRKTFYFSTIGNKLYDPVIECVKHCANGLKFFKLQRFNREERYKPL